MHLEYYQTILLRCFHIFYRKISVDQSAFITQYIRYSKIKNSVVNSTTHGYQLFILSDTLNPTNLLIAESMQKIQRSVYRLSN